MDKTILLPAVIFKEKVRKKYIYVAAYEPFNVASQGKTIEEAKNNLKKALELYLEDENIKIPTNEPMITMITLGIKATRYASHTPKIANPVRH